MNGTGYLLQETHAALTALGIAHCETDGAKVSRIPCATAGGRLMRLPPVCSGKIWTRIIMNLHGVEWTSVD